MYYVYLLRCRDGSLYTGITTDLGRRLAEHAGAGRRGARYTASHPPAWYEAAWEVPGRPEALRLERWIKALTREKKERLIQGGTLPGKWEYPPAAVPGRGAGGEAEKPPGDP